MTGPQRGRATDTAPAPPIRRSLILAGGGMKVGYQAGVMQVLLDEAGLAFDHADGTSGGCINLAQLQSGLSGTRIADNWRNTGPFDLTSLQPLCRYLLPWRLPSVLTFDRLMRQLPVWGVDFERIHGSPIAGTYNVFNFTDKLFETHPGTDAQPGPVQGLLRPADLVPGGRDRRQDLHRRRVLEGRQPARGGRPGSGRDLGHLDRVRDARLPARAVRPVLPHHRGDRRRPVLRGAAPRSRRSTPRSAPGPTPSTARSGSTSSAIATPVPLDYLLFFSAGDMSRIVDMGVRDARAYLTAQRRPVRADGPARRADRAALRREDARRLGDGRDRSADRRGARQATTGRPSSVHLAITIDDLDVFLDDPKRVAVAKGYVECPALGGRLRIGDGVFNLLDPERSGRAPDALHAAVHGAGRRAIPVRRGQGGRATRPGSMPGPTRPRCSPPIYRGDSEDGPIVGSGVLHLSIPDLARQMTTFRILRSRGPATLLAALLGFSRYFIGSAVGHLHPASLSSSAGRAGRPSDRSAYRNGTGSRRSYGARKKQ